MMNSSILERNLLSLTYNSHESARRLSKVRNSQNIFFHNSRTGLPVPYIRDKGVEKPLHSRFDPEKEGVRIAEQYIECETLIAYGLGAAFHLLPLLKSKKLDSLMIVDTNPDQIRSILSQIDLTPLFSDQRVFLWISDKPDDFNDILLSKYIPVLSGNLSSMALRSRVDTESEFFYKLQEIIRSVLSRVTDDYTVQSNFGKKWFVNTINNLQSSEDTALTLKPVRNVIITAAGPGLEDKISEIKSKESLFSIIATDTSLPVLLAADIKPDLVVTIDCQHISYNHFLAGYPKEIPLVLDLASPPFLSRIAEKCFYFTSDHPFSNYVSRYFRSFPRIDTSGGNVTHAALSLAESLGAVEIELYGSDFSYPYGKPYARGSYIYPYFQMRSNRYHGIEEQMMTFILHNKNLDREEFDEGFRYITKPMIHYKQSLELSISKMQAQVKNVRSNGVFLKDSSSPRKNQGKHFTIMGAGETYRNHLDFLKNFSEELIKLPHPQIPLSNYINDLNGEQRELLAAILPASAHFRKNAEDGKESLEQAIQWTLEILDRKLKA